MSRKHQAGFECLQWTIQQAERPCHANQVCSLLGQKLIDGTHIANAASEHQGYGAMLSDEWQVLGKVGALRTIILTRHGHVEVAATTDFNKVCAGFTEQRNGLGAIFWGGSSFDEIPAVEFDAYSKGRACQGFDVAQDA